MPNLNETYAANSRRLSSLGDLCGDSEPAFFSHAMLSTPAVKKEKRRTLIFEAETTDEDDDDEGMEVPDDDVNDVNWTPGIEMRKT